MLKDAECFTHIYLRTGRTDMRLGIDGLLAVIGGQMELDPTEPGSIFLFCGHKKDRIKALIFEGDGWLLCYKRLTGDYSYQWPRDAMLLTPDIDFHIRGTILAVPDLVGPLL